MMRGTPAGQALAPPNPFVGILPRHMWDREKTFFAAPVDFLNLAPGAKTPVQLRASDTEDLVIFYGAYIARDGAGAPVDRPALLVELTTQATGVQYQPQGKANDIENIMGTAKQPSVWPVPLIIPARRDLTVNLTNSTAAALNVRLTFMGFLVGQRTA